MALDATILGAAFDAVDADFNEQDLANLPLARQQYNQRLAAAIIDHFKNNGVLHVPGLGLEAPDGPVTGDSITGTIT